MTTLLVGYMLCIKKRTHKQAERNNTKKIQKKMTHGELFGYGTVERTVKKCVLKDQFLWDDIPTILPASWNHIPCLRLV